MSDYIKIEVKRETGTNPFEDGKFDEKMTHEQRCFALCLYIRGEPWRRIAKFFGTHYRTIQAIKTGPRYRAVRSDFQALGQESFMAKYMTEAALTEYDKWKEAHGDEIAAERQHFDHEKPGWSPVKRATANKGQHERKSTVDGTSVFFEIGWRDSNDAKKPGWYVFHKDGELGPYGTSNLAFDAATVLWDPVYAPVLATPADQPDAEQAEAARLFEAGKMARAEMEANPNAVTIAAFELAAFAIYRFVARSEGLPEPTEESMLARIDWRGFDPEPYRGKIA